MKKRKSKPIIETKLHDGTMLRLIGREPNKGRYRVVHSWATGWQVLLIHQSDYDKVFAKK
jgi:hypothetical protein